MSDSTSDPKALLGLITNAYVCLRGQVGDPKVGGPEVWGKDSPQYEALDAQLKTLRSARIQDNISASHVDALKKILEKVKGNLKPDSDMPQHDDELRKTIKASLTATEVGKKSELQQMVDDLENEMP
ncbi:hypothetical protein N0V85_001184 [Neurospora sp. IMI 360204]|nr:hypothetical protein N0V85_001184 [Neurospora sp. IMI 360204]